MSSLGWWKPGDLEIGWCSGPALALPGLWLGGGEVEGIYLSSLSSSNNLEL